MHKKLDYKIYKNDVVADIIFLFVNFIDHSYN